MNRNNIQFQKLHELYPIYQVPFVLAAWRSPTDYFQQKHTKCINVALDIQMPCLKRTWKYADSTLGAKSARVLLRSCKNCLPTLKIDQLQQKSKDVLKNNVYIIKEMLFLAFGRFFCNEQAKSDFS